MSKIIKELGEEICPYCELEEELRGSHFNPTSQGPWQCFESGCCEKAYESYLKEKKGDIVMTKETIEKMRVCVKRNDKLQSEIDDRQTSIRQVEKVKFTRDFGNINIGNRIYNGETCEKILLAAVEILKQEIEELKEEQEKIQITL